jgi:hypothetical protein
MLIFDPATSGILAEATVLNVAHPTWEPLGLEYLGLQVTPPCTWTAYRISNSSTPFPTSASRLAPKPTSPSDQTRPRRRNGPSDETTLEPHRSALMWVIVSNDFVICG